MPRGYALTLGLNAVNPRCYNGWRGQLWACEADARDIAAKTASMGFEKQKVLLTSKATRRNVMAAFKAAAEWCQPDDMFLFWNSSHGTLVPDRDGDEDRDNAILLYDGFLIDDEIWPLFAAFKPGVRVFAGFDCCHSATAARFYSEQLDIPCERIKSAPRDAAEGYWREHGAAHPRVPVTKTLEESGVEVLGIEACLKSETALAGTRNGAHTGAFLRCLDEAADHAELRARIEADLRSRGNKTQTPQLSAYSASEAFLRSKPLALTA